MTFVQKINCHIKKGLLRQDDFRNFCLSCETFRVYLQVGRSNWDLLGIKSRITFKKITEFLNWHNHPMFYCSIRDMSIKPSISGAAYMPRLSGCAC